MTVKDNATLRKQVYLNTLTVSGNGTLDSGIVDTQGAHACTFFVLCTAYTDGSHVVRPEHGEAANLSDAVDVPAGSIVDEQTPPTISAVTAALASIAKVGVFGIDRYARVAIDSTGVTGGATFIVTALLDTNVAKAA